MPLADAWRDTDARAHLGITVPDFPNLFLACGPNTVLGHGGSFITISEWQVRWILDALGRLAASDAGAVEVRPEVFDEYAERLDAGPRGDDVDRHPHDQLVPQRARAGWCAVMPWRIVDYYAMTRRVDPDQFDWGGRHRTPAHTRHDEMTRSRS